MGVIHQSLDFRRAGATHAVLLLHGLMGNPLEMQYLARQLYRAGFTVCVPYLEGYGTASRDAGARWTDWLGQVESHFDALKAQYEHVSIGGLCIGATLALALAAKRGAEIASLSLLATTLAFDGWSIPWYRFLAPLGYYTPLRHFYSYRERHPFGLKNEALRAWVAREMADTNSSVAGASHLPMASIYQAHRLIRHVRRVLPQVRTPALVVHAREDDVASLASADAVMRSIGSQQARLVVLEDSYHIITLDNEKKAVADHTAAFFNEHWGATREHTGQNPGIDRGRAGFADRAIAADAAA